MKNERYLVTGAMGCIGAWVIRNLVQMGHSCVALDLSQDKHRLELIMTSEEIANVTFIHGDITQLDIVVTAVLEHNITHIIHLAALQVPFCKENPSLGAAVNVVGTVNLFEAAKKAGIKQFVYASSLAVYGRKEEYDNRLVTEADQPRPHTHYGVYKQANEGTARIYWQDDGIASIGLRPYTLYGPARDQGLTSSPTHAMFAAARGEPFHIAYGGTNGFQYVDDIAKIFILAAQSTQMGATVYNIQGQVASMQAIIDAIEKAEPAMAGKITYENISLPFPDGQDGTELEKLLGKLPNTSLEEGVARTIAHFKMALNSGRLAT